MEKAVAVIITGRVQGVGFRAATARKAEELGLSGWVQNQPDGGVQAFAQGPREAVEAWLQWCHQGPPTARVDQVIEQFTDPDKSLKVFTIRRD
jgi:acylphosphatase